MATLRMFANARQTSGTGRAKFPGDTVGQVLNAACDEYGPEFAIVVAQCRVWLNGEPCESNDAVSETDEVALLPPVSGGSEHRHR